MGDSSLSNASLGNCPYQKQPTSKYYFSVKKGISMHDINIAHSGIVITIYLQHIVQPSVDGKQQYNNKFAI